MKPTVRYIDLARSPKKGERARLIPLDHHNEIFNGHWIRTSPVMEVRPGINGPTFATHNTCYVAAETEEDLPRAFSTVRQA